ncbi:MAG: Repeat-containing protein [Candidatus Moranbacteria bacterium GW2011_GWE1_35_17]|nr:MAG: Repeat-containing protein [Candidatus Moranbacteria bacterium GW2011_GWE1_35_17]KKP82576.1 MAG: Repeat-containing protein [Candidatus Moranbacteria bacterium GW2011_GWF2_35_54]KKP83009.1 MAG: Repeat-containing protein [Candidatus Moranbacteria bacterium GW2011_GWF1_35_5]
MKTKIIFWGLASLLFLFTGVQGVKAGSAVLTWDANTESDLAGYRIYYDTSSHTGTCPSGYPNHVDVSTGDNVGYWLSGLTTGQVYYFQVTALDDSDNESDCSTNPGEGSKTVTATSLRSDVDHSSSTGSSDALLILRKSLGLAMDQTAWVTNRVTGDANCDSSATSTDALLALRYSVGLSMTTTSWCE